MLKRIIEIKGVGCFRNTRAADLQFENLTFIYGENCYGKSTLCDIFRSISENNPLIILNRKSVPSPDNNKQKITFNFLTPLNNNEVQTTFSDSTWNLNLDSLQIYVFDTDFIHRNIFTGLSIERKNQENITRFVLGEENVEIARQIAVLSSSLRAINKNIRSIVENEFSDITDINEFINLQVVESQDVILQNIAKLNEDIHSKKELENNLNTAINREEPLNINILPDFNDFINRLNFNLASNYKQIQESVSETILSHIQHNCQNNPNAENWLRQGLKLVSNNNCPFCGQPILNNAKILLAAYSEYFNEAFEKYENEINNLLDKHFQEILEYQHIDLLEKIQNNRNILNTYPELLQNTEFLQKYQNNEALITKISELFGIWQKSFSIANRIIQEKISLKRSSLFKKIDPLEIDKIIENYRKLANSVIEYNSNIKSIIEEIKKFKAGLNAQSLRDEIQGFESLLALESLKLKRLNLSTTCIKYSQLVVQRNELSEQIKNLNDELEQNQTNYLASYFKKINDIFSRLGSNNFEIHSNISHRGNMPVIELNATFLGEPITNDKLLTFFSESDRRALALSIFIAKLESLTEAQKNHTILVLDDPVTSFDDGRIDRTIRIFDLLRNSFRQMIILSHYSRYLKSFFQRAYFNNNNIKLLKITRDNESSHLSLASSDDFVETEHQRKFRSIMGFIERSHQDDILLDLRVYLENEVKTRYMFQINQNSLSSMQFNDLLDNLFTLQIISKEIREEIEGLRLSLNVDHHSWSERTQEEKIALATDVINFIYTKL